MRTFPTGPIPYCDRIEDHVSIVGERSRQYHFGTLPRARQFEREHNGQIFIEHIGSYWVILK